jgi:hypothetical protein
MIDLLDDDRPPMKFTGFDYTIGTGAVNKLAYAFSRRYHCRDDHAVYGCDDHVVTTTSLDAKAALDTLNTEMSPFGVVPLVPSYKNLLPTIWKIGAELFPNSNIFSGEQFDTNTCVNDARPQTVLKSFSLRYDPSFSAELADDEVPTIGKLPFLVTMVVRTNRTQNSRWMTVSCTDVVYTDSQLYNLFY